MERKTLLGLIFACLFTLTSCSFNPFTTDNELTGSPIGAGIGAGIGGVGAALITSSKPLIVVSALGGGAIGYYLTTLRFASGGIIQAGGQVYTLGDFVGIDIPTDPLFDTNSDEFYDDAGPILDSLVKVLSRYPDRNILISGNTSGFGPTKLENKLSQDRARQIAAYLWAHGITDVSDKDYDIKTGINTDTATQTKKWRRLIYVGYGNYFPIANNLSNDSLRQNSRIQITVFPTSDQLYPDRFDKRTHRYAVFRNVGGLGEPPISRGGRGQRFSGDAFHGVIHEADYASDSENFGGLNENAENNSISSRASKHSDYYKEHPEDVWGEYKVKKHHRFSGYKDELGLDR